MNNFSAIPLTGAPFPRAEYEQRRRRVLAALERTRLDGLVVTAKGHLQYLSGYDGRGGYFGPFPLILALGRAPTFVVRKYDEDAVRSESCVDDVVSYTQQDEFGAVCADVLRRNGLQGGRVGFELGCWNLAPADVAAVQSQLPDLKIVDASGLVASVAAVKSELELEAMRASMAFTDVAVQTFQRSLRAGVTETGAAAAVEAAVARAGGALPHHVGRQPEVPVGLQPSIGQLPQRQRADVKARRRRAVSSAACFSGTGCSAT